MRYVYVALVLVITVFTGAIEFEGLEQVTLIAFQVTLPVPVLLLFIYFVGLFAGTLACTVVQSLHETSPATTPNSENGLN